MKNWVRIYLISFVFILCLIGVFNYFMDSSWTFFHSHNYNNIQKATDERQLKSNYLYYTDKKFDTLLLGSSRTTYMNTNSFLPFKVFNFSAGGMMPYEYLFFIDFVIKDLEQPIDNIIIGMDFFGYLGKYRSNYSEKVINNIKINLYRWKILFSIDTFKNSINNLRYNFNESKSFEKYNRNLIKTYSKITDLKIQKDNVKKDIINYVNTKYNQKKDDGYYDIIVKIRSKYNDKKFIIYTTPISDPLFQEITKLGHIENYKNWLRTLVDIFGSVHHFMYPNSVSKNYLNYFFDANHAYPETNDIVAKTIVANENIIEDFGLILTKENIESYLRSLD